MAAEPEPVTSYLIELGRALSGPPEHVERIVDEARAHLLDAVDAHRGAGRDEAAAVTAALREFGAVPEVVTAADRAAWRRDRGPVLRAVIGVLVRLAATGMVLAGVVGVAAAGLAGLTSVEVVFRLPAGAAVPAGACVHWLSVHPAAVTCQQAGTLEAADDLPLFAGVTGVLGALVWLVVLTLRRPRARVLPAALESAAGAALFGAAGAGAAVLAAADAVVSTTWGAGMFWTATAGALAVAAGCTARTWRALAGSRVAPGR